MFVTICQVKDTVEVDFNVSRHLEFELAAKDWSVLVRFCS
jgi:ethanolamine phosphate transferase 2 subunit G